MTCEAVIGLQHEQKRRLTERPCPEAVGRWLAAAIDVFGSRPMHGLWLGPARPSLCRHRMVMVDPPPLSTDRLRQQGYNKQVIISMAIIFLKET